ncbi:MAG: hypothetical protein K0Q72_621 [Armatimonadetes bacterium]|jgi:hypothetical protein|nr:hypothetical protein [Armatimonadota bacterium]
METLVSAILLAGVFGIVAVFAVGIVRELGRR